MKDQMTPKAEHTPGPWEIYRYSLGATYPSETIVKVLQNGTIYRICDVTFPASPPGTVGAEERLANARLIAAAPKYADDRAALLAACKALYWAETPSGHDHARELARAAIAKAEGEGK